MRKRSQAAPAAEVAAAFGHGRPRDPQEVQDEQNGEPPLKPSVAETSKQLNEELKKNAPKTKIEEAFEYRNRRGDDTSKNLDPEFEKIAETIIISDPHGEYIKLENALKVGDKRTDYHSLMQSLDEAETNARRAHKLMVTAKLERDRWERENAIVFAGMRDKAHDTLQEEKKQGLRNKQITDADVDNMCAVLFADEWKAQEMKRRRIELMVRSMENLNEMWISRCRSLQAMLAKLR